MKLYVTPCILVNVGSGNALFLDGTKPSPDLMLIIVNWIGTKFTKIGSKYLFCFQEIAISLQKAFYFDPALTHWGRVTHLCVGKLTIIGSDNGLSPERCHAIIWTNAGILLIGPLGTNFSEILIGIQTFSFKKMHLNMPSAKWRPFVSASMC